MIIKMNITGDYSKEDDVKLNGIKLSPDEISLLTYTLAKHRQGRKFENLLYLDQVEVLYWAVGYGLEQPLEIPNLKYLLRIIVIKQLFNRYLNDFTSEQLEAKIIQEMLIGFRMLKEAFPREV